MKQSEIKRLVKLGIARDITNAEFTELPPFEVLSVSRGIYGMNGALLKETLTGNLMAITARNSLLFAVV